MNRIQSLVTAALLLGSLAAPAVFAQPAPPPAQPAPPAPPAPPAAARPKRASRVIVQGPGSSFLGVGVAEVDADRVKALNLKEERGAEVTSVEEDSPAAKAGLKAGDVITAADGEKVTTAGDLSRIINKKDDGAVTLTVVHDRNTRTMMVTPEKNPERLPRPGTIGTRRIAIPSIAVPAIPEINIQVPRIVIPATPKIDVTVPSRAPRPGRARVVII